METQTTLKPGDKVRIKTLEHLREEFGRSGTDFQKNSEANVLSSSMTQYCGQEVTIKGVLTRTSSHQAYTIEEDPYRRIWEDWMFDFSPEPKTQDGRKYYFHHIRTKKKNRLRATVVGVYDENSNLLLSAAVCSKKDQFSRKRGRELAITRLNLCHSAALHHNPAFLPDEIQSRGRFFLQVAKEFGEEVMKAPNILTPIPNETKYKTNVTEEKV